VTLQLLLSPAAVSRGTGRELGGARLGGGAPAVDWPEQAISAPLLGTTADSLRETWLADGPASAGVSEGIAWRRAGDLLYGVVELAEAGFAGAGIPPLQAVLAGGRQMQRRQKVVQHLDLPTRDDGQRTAQQTLQPGQHGDQDGVWRNGVRGLGQRHERAVEVEEQGGSAGGEWGCFHGGARVWVAGFVDRHQESVCCHGLLTARP